MIKKKINTSLKRFGFYENLKSFYINLQYEKYYSNHQNDYNFYKKLLNKKDLVFDIGANKGNKTNIFLKLKSKVIAVEPDKTNQKVLHSRFNYNDNLIVVNKIVSDKIGVETLNIVSDGNEVNTCSDKWKEVIENNENNRFEADRSFTIREEIESTTLSDLIKKFGSPKYIKIDVEGYEYNVLKGLKSCVNMISFEANIPEFIDESKKCIDIINNLSENYSYKFTDTINFQSNNWVNFQEIMKIIETTKLNCIEIYAKFK